MRDKEIIRGVLNRLWTRKIKRQTLRDWLCMRFGNGHDADLFCTHYLPDGSREYHWRLWFDDYKLYFAVSTPPGSDIVTLEGGYWEKIN